MLMTKTLHIVHCLVNRFIAHSAFEPKDVLFHDVGMNLARIRKLRGLSQAALGQMIGRDPATIQRAETMHRSAKLETYLMCCDVLGITLADIFCDDVSPMEREILAAFRSIPESQQEAFGDLVRRAAASPPPAGR